LGMIENLVYPNKISVIFMDSIPLFAIPFRFLSGVLPETFQYFGIWIMLCFVLQGGVSALLIQKLTNSKFAALVGSIVFVFSTVLLHNLLIQDSLSAHWLILCAFALWIYRDKIKSFKMKLILYSILSMLCILIHTYFIVMIGIISFFSLLQEVISKDNELNIKQGIIILVSMVASALIVAGCLGALFSGEQINNDDSQWTAYAGYLDSFINSNSNMGKSNILEFQERYFAFEGYAYLGVGVMILCLLSITLMIIHKKVNIYMLIMGLIFLVMSLGTNIIWNGDIIATWRLPDINIVKEFCGIFRVNGRFIWPTFYLVILSTFYYIYKYIKPSIANIVIAICVVIQLFDLSNIIAFQKNFDFSKEYKSPLVSEAWEELADNHNQILVNVSPDWSFAFETYAIKNDLAINFTYSARENREKIDRYIEQQYEELNNNNPNEDIIYIFRPEENYLPECLNLYYLDGMYVGTTDILKNVKEEEIYHLVESEQI